MSADQPEAAKVLAQRSRKQLLEQVAAQAAELETLRAAAATLNETIAPRSSAEVAAESAQTYSARLALAGVIAAAFITTIGTVVGVVLDEPTTPTTSSQGSSTSSGSTTTGEQPVSCRIANEEVSKTLATGQRDPARLETVNNEATDKQCGEEVDLAREILETNPDLGKK